VKASAEPQRHGHPAIPLVAVLVGILLFGTAEIAASSVMDHILMSGWDRVKRVPASFYPSDSPAAYLRTNDQGQAFAGDKQLPSLPAVTKVTPLGKDELAPKRRREARGR